MSPNQISESLFLIRGAERFGLVCLAMMCVWTGWNLFRHGIVVMQQAEFSKTTFGLKSLKAGPGVFFALSGVLLGIYLVRAPVRIQDFPGDSNAANHPADQQPRGLQISYFGDGNSENAVRVVQSVNTLLSTRLEVDQSQSTTTKEAFTKALGILRGHAFNTEMAVMHEVTGKSGDSLAEYLIHLRNSEDKDLSPTEREHKRVMENLRRGLDGASQ